VLVEKHASIEELKEKLEIEKEAEKDQKAGKRARRSMCATTKRWAVS